MIDRIAKVICPEAFDRDAFRRIVKENNDGHTAGIDIAASMQQARDAARAKAREVLEVVRGSSDALDAALTLLYVEQLDVAADYIDGMVRHLDSPAAKVLRNPATSKRAKTAAGKGMTQR